MLWDSSIQLTSNSEVKGSRTDYSSNDTVETRLLVIILTVCLQIENKRSQPVSRTLSTRYIFLSISSIRMQFIYDSR